MHKSYKIAWAVHLPISLIGGGLYVLLELIWRGRSHWTMFLLGGVCFVLIGLINEASPAMPLLLQMVVGAVTVTVLELVVGLILNVWLGLSVWDYSDMAFNLWGQVCLAYTVLWFFLSGVVVWLEDRLHVLLRRVR